MLTHNHFHMPTDRSKRNFLRGSLGTVASVAALSGFPPAIRRALAIEANNATGTINDVEHVVMLMMENRSFDSYFGTFRGVRGYGDRFIAPAANGYNILYQSDTRSTPVATYIPFHLDQAKGNAQRAGGTPHTWHDTQAAWDQGRMARWPEAKTPLSMGYFDAAEVPFQRALADAFTVCDHYHCGMHTGTSANRLFFWTGTNGPNGRSPADGKRVEVAMLNNQYDAGNNIGPSTEGWTWTTYADRLEQAGVRWKVYQSLVDNFGCNEMMSFRHWRAEIEKLPAQRRPLYVQATDINQDVTRAGAFYDAAVDDALSPLAKGFHNTMPHGFLETLRQDIAGGTLPAVSWIIAPSAYSEHPDDSSPARGGWYVQQVLDALTEHPQVWSKTVLLVNFDENDGLFDHMPTPCAPSVNPDGGLAGATTLNAADIAVEYHNYTPASAQQPAIDGRPYGPGPRVPMWVVSPWSRGGWVNSQVFDHTSVLQFLERRFGVLEPQISAYRRAVCGDLSSCFNFVSPNAGALPVLGGRSTRADVDAQALAQSKAGALNKPTVAPGATLPAQASGTRPSRALPYVLHVTARADAGNMALRFDNDSGARAGAVFHVYDELHLDRIPRRYVVEAGKSLEGSWDLAPDRGVYRLWVLGPNGFHRRFAGDLGEQDGADGPEIRVRYEAGANTGVTVEIHNDGPACAFTATAEAYRNDGPWTIEVAGGGVGTFHWPLADSGNWYDFTITSGAQKSFRRRCAGRIENGRDSISDPAMGIAPRAI